LCRGLALLLAILFGALPSTATAPHLAPPAISDGYSQEFLAVTHKVKINSGRDQERHLAVLGVLRWHEQGFRGQQVKIAVLDSGFQGYKEQLGRALPDQVTTRSFRADGKLEFRDSQHGLLCAEVVHAVAPEAELIFVNWEPNDPSSFLQAVRWAKEQGAKVITCSLIMPSWSDGEGGGIVNQDIARSVGNGKQTGDMLFFASAGNTAQRHWCGTFTEDNNGYHQWKPGENVNTLFPWGKDRVAVEIYGPSAGDYELLVVDPLTEQCVGEKQVRQLGTKTSKVNCLLVRFTPEPGQSYQIKLRSKRLLGPGERDKIHLVVLGGELTHYCCQGSISCPADGPGVCAVGAVNQDGKRWNYSSCGPNSAFPKPDYVALVPFPSTLRPQPFGGTSAAAPQAAGLAALWWAKNPGWTAGQVKEVMRQTALDLGPPGHDYETGHGQLRLP
jgi:hypothetical protein